MLLLGLSKGIWLSRDSVWERSPSHRGAGRAKTFSHRGGCISLVEMSHQKESHRGFHSWISAPTSAALRIQASSKCHQLSSPHLHISTAAATSKSSSHLSSSTARSPHFLLSQPSGLFWTQHPWWSFHQITIHLQSFNGPSHPGENDKAKAKAQQGLPKLYTF